MQKEIERQTNDFELEKVKNRYQIKNRNREKIVEKAKWENESC